MRKLIRVIKSSLKKRSTWIGVIFVLLLLTTIHFCSRKSSQQHKDFIIARDSNWYPLQLMGKERSLVAFTNDLLYDIARDTNFRYSIIDAGPDSLIEGLDSHSYDAIMSTMIPTDVNKEKYYFSEPFFLSGPVLVVRQDSPVTSLREMEGKTLGIRSNSSLIFNPHITSQAPINYSIFTFDSINKGLDMVVNNQIDGFIMDSMLAYAYTSQGGFYAGLLKIASLPLTNEGLRLVALKVPHSEMLIQKFDEGLKELRANGTFDALIKKWNLINPLQINLKSEDVKQQNDLE